MIKITKENEKTIKQVAKAAANRSGIHAYENILIEVDDAVTITAGDSVTELSAKLDCETKSKGSLSVNAQKLVAALSACGFECELSFTADDVKIKGKKRKFTLAGLPADHYPKMPEDSNAEKIDVDSMSLIESVRQAASIAPVNDVRHILNGVYVGDGVAASDGHRAVIIDGVNSNGFIVSKSAINAIPDIENGDVLIGQNQLAIVGGVTLRSKLIDGKFPDIKRIIQPATSTMRVDVSEFSDAIKAALVTADKDSNAVRIYIGENSTIESAGAKKDSAKIEFDCEKSDHYEGGFNAKYLLDALSFYSGVIDVGFTDGHQMVINDNGIQNVVMGIRL